MRQRASDKTGLHLVTEGGGFVGSALVSELIKRGESVRVLDLEAGSSMPKTVEFYQGNILDRDFVCHSMKGVFAVHHCAALVPVTRAGKAFEEVNSKGTQIVFEEARRAGAKHFCHMSSSAVFDASAMNGPPLDEDARRSPFEPYGKSKKMAEDYLLSVMPESPEIKCVILRPRMVIGPGRLGVLELIFELIRCGAPVYLLGRGEAPFQLVDVRDLVQASVDATQFGVVGVFNLGTDRYGSLHEALKNLCLHANTGSFVIRLPVRPAQLLLSGLDFFGLSPLNAWHYLSSHRAWHFKIAKAQDQLHWRPKFSNDQMLGESYDSYLRHGRPSATGPAHLSGIKWGILSLLKLGRHVSSIHDDPKPG